MKKLFFVFIAITFLQYLGNAQSNVSIMDVSVQSYVETDSISGLPVDTSIVNLKVSFKIKNVNEANEAYILFGTSQNIGDIKSLTSNFIYDSGEYKLSYNGNIYPVNQYTAMIDLSLTLDEEDDYSYITVYVIDSNNTESNRIYFTK